jgi:long-chain acyl-CoA synthetase
MDTMWDLVTHMKKWGERIALSEVREEKRNTISFHRLYEDILDYARGYLELGLKKSDKIAVFSSNNINWVGFTLGMNITGIINVPRGENSSADDMSYIIEHSDARFAIVENEFVLKKLEAHRPDSLRDIFTIDTVPGYRTIEEIRALGKKSRKKPAQVEGEDIASIIYTSGTTGRPKGVILCHRNIIKNITTLHERVPTGPEDKAISALPAWHAFEWGAKLFWLLSGAECHYSRIVDLPKAFEREKPTMMPSVPRIWEASYKRMFRKINAEPLHKRVMIKGMIALSIDCVRRKGRFDPLKIVEIPLYRLMEKKVFSLLREKMGGRVRYAISGGGKLPGYLDDFFHTAGIEILEGYGLTETSPIIAARTPGKHELYSVGTPLRGVEVKVVDPESGVQLPAGTEGLIFVRGHNVMKGYYKDDEGTARAIIDGWLNTGDKGRVDERGCLVITGRYKETIVLYNGENVNPGAIEDELSKSPYITQAFVFDAKSRWLSALIVPNFEVLKEYCEANRIPYNDRNIPKTLETVPVKGLFEKEIRKLVNRNQRLKSFEFIRSFELLPAEFEIGREYTETLKMKRDTITRLYHSKISSLTGSAV